ncbi:MAG: DNA-processing protein DprA [Nitriliruptoraceae bacterium]
MSGVRLDRLTEVLVPIAAPGTDPEMLASLLAWAVRPRRTLESLRRLMRDTGAEDPVSSARWRLHIETQLREDDVRAAMPLVVPWRARGCRLAMVGDPAYPDRVADGWPDSDAPILLAMAGALPPDGPAVAIVGSRRATSYGSGVAAWLAGAASAAGVRVVSGGAIGVDAAAHRGAVGGPGGTTVVLGCGHDVDYPRPHARAGGLFDEVRAHGGTILSEQLPFAPPRAGVVRARNRIVAALADVTVVVEGGTRSGALLTASAAIERGRPVLAVPGDVRAPGSAAPHRLLAEGAAPCTGPDDLLDALGSSAPAAAPEVDGVGDRGGLPTPLFAVLAAAWPRAIPMGQIADDSGMATGAALAALTRAQVAGVVVERPDGLVLRRSPSRTTSPT